MSTVFLSGFWSAEDIADSSYSYQVVPCQLVACWFGLVRQELNSDINTETETTTIAPQTDP